jgi:putative transcription antitermination factor YqgF
MARKFARRLSKQFEITVELVDERLSTAEARALAANDKKHSVDAYAAVLIAQSWLTTQ